MNESKHPLMNSVLLKRRTIDFLTYAHRLVMPTKPKICVLRSRVETQSVLQYDGGNCFQDGMGECNGIALLLTCIWNNNKPSHDAYWIQR